MNLRNLFYQNWKNSLIYLDLFFAFLGIILSLMDLKTRKVSLVLIYSYVFIFSIFYCDILIQYFYGIGFNLIMYFICRLISRGGLGSGDIHYSICVAIFLKGSIILILISNLFSSLIGILVFLALLIIKGRMIIKYRIPFVPFMFFGSCIARILENVV